MTTNDILIVLKTDLQISAPKYDSFLTKYIALAKAAIRREGIILQETESCTGATKEGEKIIEVSYITEDGMLIAMYAAYLYRKRKEEKGAMPRMLRYELNQRLFSQKGSKN